MPHRIILVGGGHTHLHVVEQWAKRPIRRAELILVSAFDRATYSGMLPGVLTGQYAPREMEVDLVDLCDWANVRLVQNRVTGIDRHLNVLQLANGERREFDIASLGIGSVPSFPDGMERLFQCVPIKPMQTFLNRLHQKLESALVLSRTSGDPSRPIEVTILGGGAAGFEIACCLDRNLRSRNVHFTMTLVHGGAEILPGFSSRAVRLARAAMEAKGIRVQCGQRVIRAESRGGFGTLMLRDGGERRTDLCILATQASAPDDLAAFPLPKTQLGFLAVHPTLQSTSDRSIFAVGDTAEILDSPVPKAGVYAVREGPILWENLQRMVTDRPLVPYRPQRRFLSLLNTGDGKAILQYHGIASHGRCAWWLKDRIDRRFVQRFRPNEG